MEPAIIAHVRVRTPEDTVGDKAGGLGGLSVGGSIDNGRRNSLRVMAWT
jgi:hypothetical protein